MSADSLKGGIYHNKGELDGTEGQRGHYPCKIWLKLTSSSEESLNAAVGPPGEREDVANSVQTCGSQLYRSQRLVFKTNISLLLFNWNEIHT